MKGQMQNAGSNGGIKHFLLIAGFRRSINTILNEAQIKKEKNNQIIMELFLMQGGVSSFTFPVGPAAVCLE